jgi:diguanylate cyclase (GGDEF)-like protein
MAADVSSLSRLRGLLEVTRLVRSHDELPDVLAAVARTVSESLGWGIVVVNLYRRAWNDFIVTTVHGSEAARRALLAKTGGWDAWGSLLDDRFRRRGAFLIPHGSFDWHARGAPTFVAPAGSPASGPHAWHPEDALLVPMAGADGHLLGVLSVDAPASGARPNDDEVDVLVAFAEHAALAVDEAQTALAAERHRTALEQLLRVSSRLAESFDVDAILDEVASAISVALGFEKVAIDLPDAAGNFRSRTMCGWRRDEPTVTHAVRLAELEPFLAPEHEVEGCYLVPPEAAPAQRRVRESEQSYRSVLNGRGPHAWRNHWLCVPLQDREGHVIGLIWADDPRDRLLPSREFLQALRAFANQATTALESAAQFAEMRFLAEHDPLTRLLNRRAFGERLDAEIARAQRYRRPFALVLCDIDGFKDLNDRHGHQAGDLALERVASLLDGALRQPDDAFRVGGDEFALILVESSKAEARVAVERIAQAMAAAGDELLGELSLSFGIAIYPGDGGGPDELFRRADEALYGAKRSGAPIRFAA